MNDRVERISTEVNRTTGIGKIVVTINNSTNGITIELVVLLENDLGPGLGPGLGHVMKVPNTISERKSVLLEI